MRQLSLCLLVAFGFVAFGLVACSTVPSGVAVVDDPSNLPSLQQLEADKLAQVRPRITISQFRSIFPDAYIVGQTPQMTAYEVAQTTLYVTKFDVDRQYLMGDIQTRQKKQVLRFYFSHDRLVNWGKPDDWPQNKLVAMDPALPKIK